MIGFYDYTVVLTYISLMCSVFGITQAIGGHYRTAIICLALSGLFDMFDGRLQEPKRTVLMMKNYLAFRLIPFAM